GRFIVITGESGAGKSSLVRALELVSGKRAQSSIIRAGVEEAEVRAALEMDAPLSSLPEEFQPQEGFILVKRVVSSTGRAKSYLQEKPVPLNTLAGALSKVVAIQSQFAQLELLEPEQQVELLDHSGGEILREIRSNLSMAVSSAIENERKLLEVSRKRREIEARYQDGEAFLEKYRRMEIRPGCESEWETDLNRVSGLLKRQAGLRLLHDRMTGGSSGEGLSAAIEQFGQDIRQSVDGAPELEVNIERLLTASQEIEKALKAFVSIEREQSLQEEFEKIEKKIGTLRKLMRYAKVDSAEDLVDFADRLDLDLQWLRESREKLALMQENSACLKKEVSNLALSLREARKNAARRLEESVNASLGSLAMEGLRFGITLKPLEKVRQSGADDISFFLSDGKHLQGPVSRIASGGELSRILLALQIAASDDMLPRTLVFDEVEAGLGGRSAFLAGQALRELSRRCQVVLITHEASIASLADQHFRVEREGDNSQVLEVDGKQRVRELARMLAGDPDDPEATDLARSLLEGNRRETG
ncbi:MAG TPA: AAA family ATPase, partial [Synergistales bacterium]|nr:AAA family ATPase [Synergistales bacterium]